MDSLRELYVDELKDLYSAEKQLVKALPKMALQHSLDEEIEADKLLTALAERSINIDAAITSRESSAR